MRKTCSILAAALCTLIAFSSREAVAMNGKHVTVINGKMVLSTIAGNVVIARQTINDFTVYQPQFSFDGTKIVCFKHSGSKWYVSIMDVTSHAFTDVLDLSQWADVVTRGRVRWPAGDWIYFERPDRNVKGTGELWRINSKDPSRKEMVVDYVKPDVPASAPNSYTDNVIYDFVLTPDLRLSLMSLNGTIWGTGHGGQFVHYFPPYAGDPGSPDAMLINLPNCNPCLSPTGAFCGRFEDGGHTSIHFYQWNQSTQLYADMTGLPSQGYKITTDNMEAWSGSVDWAGVLENPDWSVNSDRWMLIKVGLPDVSFNLGNGCNAVAFSWKDQACIRLTSNGAGTAASTGSMFVEGGPANGLQDINGTWNVIAPVELIPHIEVSGTKSPYRVTLSSLPAGADLYYTTDNSDPTQSSTHYGGPFSVTVPADALRWLKVRAYMTGQAPSTIERKRLLPTEGTGLGLTCQVWKNLHGSQISDLTLSSRYPNSPDDTWIAHNLSTQYGNWWTQAGFWDSKPFGYRMSGYIIPPVTGSYVFSITALNSGSLRLGTSSDPASAVEIARATTPPAGWPAGTASTGQIPLVSGTWYWIEVLQKTDTLNTNTQLSVSWRTPWGETESPVPGVRLMPRSATPTASASPRSPRLDNRAPVGISGSCGKVAIYDAQGHLVAIQSGRSTPMSMRNAPGVYFVKSMAATGRTISRMVIRGR